MLSVLSFYYQDEDDEAEEEEASTSDLEWQLRLLDQLRAGLIAICYLAVPTLSPLLSSGTGSKGQPSAPNQEDSSNEENDQGVRTTPSGVPPHPRVAFVR